MRISDWSSDVCSSDLTSELVDVTERIEKGGRPWIAPACGLDRLGDPDRRVRSETVAHGLVEVLGLIRTAKPTFRKSRSEERRGGKECVSTCRYRGAPYH